MLIDHFDSFRETCEVRDGTILLCLLCLFFHMKWVWKILIESSSIGAWAKSPCIGHALSESHSI